jgi:hypothetical protein
VLENVTMHSSLVEEGPPEPSRPGGA